MSLNGSFFRSAVKDECIYEDTSMACPNNTIRGNLCAFAEGQARVYSCSALDSMCWTFAQDCSGGGTQRQCLKDGAEWCCRSFETCTEIDGQINVCWAPWDNPNENRSVPDAMIYNQANFPVLPALSTASAAEPTATRSSLAGLSATESSTTASTTTEISTPSGSSLSLGSVIGIGIGCGLAGVALAAGVGFLSFRRRERGGSPGPAQQFDQPGGMRAQNLDSSSGPMAEIDDGRLRSELPVDTAVASHQETYHGEGGLLNTVAPASSRPTHPLYIYSQY